MLITIDSVIGAPVVSLRTSQPLGVITEPIINPYTLKVVAFYVDGPMVQYDPAVIFTEDIRALDRRGVLIDSAENIMSPVDMVRLNEVIAYDFHLVKLLVVDNHKQKLGHVGTYIVDSHSFNIMQIVVQPRFWKSLSVTELTISRNQIIEIDDKKIVVKAPDIRLKEPAKKMPVDEKLLNPEFDNPFRKPKSRPAESAGSR